jgi:hypothetical protein
MTSLTPGKNATQNIFYKAFTVFWYLKIKSGIQVDRYSISLKGISVIAYFVHI